MPRAAPPAPLGGRAGRSAHQASPTAVRSRPHPSLPTLPHAGAQVFTRNQRSVLLLRSPEYGLVAYVAVGATVRLAHVHLGKVPLYH